MKINRPVRITLAVLAVLAALVWGAWLIALPGSLITGKLDRGLENGPVKIEFEGFRKGLFYSLKADGLRVFKASGDTEILYLEGLRAGLNVRSLFRFDPCLDFSAALAGGNIRGRACAKGALDLDAEGVDLSGLGMESLITGLRLGGKAWLEVHTVEGTGEARFKVTGMNVLPYKYMGFSLPLDLLRQSRGLVLIDNGIATVESATLEGDGIYARVKGKAGGGRVDMKLEIMPSEEVENSQPYFKMLQMYQVTPGLYEIPINMPY